VTAYRIVCTNQTGCSAAGHIIGVGTGSDAGWTAQWTVGEVYRAMQSGHTFYTYGGGARASVKPYNCACGNGSLRSGADATTANNLDSLNLCRLSA